MSTVATCRARHSIVLVLLCALLAATVLGPVLVAPTAASASVCDGTVLSGVCGEGTLVDGVGDAVGDVAKATVKGVKEAGSWAGRHAGPILRTLAAAGVVIGTWVACSKVTKAIAAAGGGAAAGAASGGVATAGGAVGGYAAAEAVCQIVRRGGKVVLKVGKQVVKQSGKLANLAKLAAGATGLAWIAFGTQHGAAWVLSNLLDVDGRSGKEIGASWVAQIRSNINAVGLVVLVLTMYLAAMSLMRHRGAGAEDLLIGVLYAAVAVSIFGSVLYLTVSFTDAVTNGFVRSSWGQRALGNWSDLGDSYAHVSPGRDAQDTLTGAATGAAGNGTPADDGRGPWVLRIILMVLTILFGGLTWVELQVREGALLLLAIFSGLALVASASPRHRGISSSFAMLSLGVVAAKLVIVVTLLVGGSMAQMAAAGETASGSIKGMLIGVGLMGLAALLGWWVVAWLGLHGAGQLDQLRTRVGMPHLLAGGGNGGGWGSRGGGGGGPGDGPRPGGHPDGPIAGAPSRPGGTVRDLASSAAGRITAGLLGIHPAAPRATGAAGEDRVAQARQREQARPTTTDPSSAPDTTTGASERPPDATAAPTTSNAADSTFAASEGPALPPTNHLTASAAAPVAEPGQSAPQDEREAVAGSTTNPPGNAGPMVAPPARGGAPSRPVREALSTPAPAGTAGLANESTAAESVSAAFGAHEAAVAEVLRRGRAER